MKRIGAGAALVFCLLETSCAENLLKVPDEFLGQWNAELQTQSGFPWWKQVKYPSVLVITKNQLQFVDQAGFECTSKDISYDKGLGAVVFRHCLPTKSDLDAEPFYRLYDRGDHLLGETWRQKLLFRWRLDKAQN